MRRMVSLFVSAALLVVSSVPIVSAAVCQMPAQATAAMHDEGMHGSAMHRHAMAIQTMAVPDTMAMPTISLHAGHDHSEALAGDWQRCRIECGCGCHRSIDTLPHLLAPHSADNGFQPEILASERTLPVVSVRLSGRDLALNSPPPDSL